MGGDVVSPDTIRAMFSAALSAMYMSEVPQFRTLAQLVCDARIGGSGPERGDGKRPAIAERHGAIRLGSAAELFTMGRLFAVMGMRPVGYYDLSPAGIPVHSTAFRPVTEESLRNSPFRIFTSLLRLDLIQDIELRKLSASILSQRRIFTDRALELLSIAEKHGLNQSQARDFISETVQTFRWRREATVGAGTYHRLHAVHPLLADVVCFSGPHVNHLALATLDIEAVQSAMLGREDMTPKDFIEGPPRRRCPILLRQTSFRALSEPIWFKEPDGSLLGGFHAARFGEIEERGAALTAKGRALYDRILNDVLSNAPPTANRAGVGSYVRQLQDHFSAFPDSHEIMRADDLAFFRYEAETTASKPLPATCIEQLVQSGSLNAYPMQYEDFLPVSAAGIFRSNLSGTGGTDLGDGGDRTAFEDALAAEVLDEIALYSKAEGDSLDEALQTLGLQPGSLRERWSRRQGPP